jgi:hypothetical protein
MIFTTLTELNETLIRHPLSKYGRLRLDNYLVLVAENEETNDFLTRLEHNGYLPPTVAWFSQEAWKVRLYRRAEGMQTDGADFAGLSLSVLTGADTRCLVASPLNRLRDFDDLGDESLLEDVPAALDRQALKVLQSLIFLTDCMWFQDGEW